jgi:hypothetical protein
MPIHPVSPSLSLTREQAHRFSRSQNSSSLLQVHEPSHDPCVASSFLPRETRILRRRDKKSPNSMPDPRIRSILCMQPSAVVGRTRSEQPSNEGISDSNSRFKQTFQFVKLFARFFSYHVKPEKLIQNAAFQNHFRDGMESMSGCIHSSHFGRTITKLTGCSPF